MNTKDRLYAWLNNGTFNESKGCRHPQDIIAAALGCSERTVIRCVQQLEREGRLTVTRPRRRGACNTYYVATWNPAKRAGVLNVLECLRPSILKRREERLRSTCHPKRTTTAEEGSYAYDTSSSVSPCKRCQHAARASRIVRRSLMCERPECQQNVALLAKASDELVDAYGTIKTLGKENTNLKRELSSETSPLAQDVHRVLEFWQEKHPQAGIDPLGWRAKLVRGALKLGHTAPPLPCPKHDLLGDGEKRDKMARCTVADELIEAIEGLRLMPFTGSKGRCAVAGPGTRRFDGIEYALTAKSGSGGRAPSEATIETFRGYARWAELAPSGRLFVAYQRTGDVHEEYARLLQDALAREGSKGYVSPNGNGAAA